MKQMLDGVLETSMLKLQYRYVNKACHAAEVDF